MNKSDSLASLGYRKLTTTAAISNGNRREQIEMPPSDFLEFQMSGLDPDELSQRHSLTPAKLIFRPLPPNKSIEEVSFHYTLGDLEYSVGYAKSGLQIISSGYQDFIFICISKCGISTLNTDRGCIGLNKSVGVIGSSDIPKVITLDPLSSCYMLSIRKNRIKRAVLAQTGRISQKDVEFVSEFAIDRAPGLLIKMIAETLFQGLVKSDFLLRSELASVALVEALIEIVLGSLLHNFSHLYENTASVVAPARLKRAVDYINANATLPITVEDIASAANLNVRTLYVSFRRYYDTTPRIFLHRIRLESVRRELQEYRGEQSMKDIAQRWGFFHMGRFAAQYRKAFGERPSETRSNAPK